MWVAQSAACGNMLDVAAGLAALLAQAVLAAG